MTRALILAAALVASPAYAQADDEPIVVENFRIRPAETAPTVSYRIDKPKGVTRSDVMKWETAYLALSAVDLVQTVSCLEKRTCKESNPLWGKDPKAPRLIIGKIIGGAIHFYTIDRISRRDPKTALRAAQLSVGLQGGVVGWNLRVIL